MAEIELAIGSPARMVDKGFFFGNSVFTLIYEFIHNPDVAPVYLPWVYASLQFAMMHKPMADRQARHPGYE
jgi:hypothetical protein